ncbi:MAG: methyltransferase [Candidatus Micrarchaeota archaeon]|nr:methyltransferase [Candidatus Micrarchaeota archaeon]
MLNYRNLKLEIFEQVYEPAEDSFMLADYVSKIKGEILEIGCGSGIVSLSAAVADKNNQVLGVDINSLAVKNAEYNRQLNKLLNAKFMVSGLFSKVPKKKFDFILFNPPYLPTNKSEKLSGIINHAFDGGKDGRKVLDRFLAEFEHYLKKDGSLLLVHSSLNNSEKTMKFLEKKFFICETLSEQSFFFEKLILIKATRRL